MTIHIVKTDSSALPYILEFNNPNHRQSEKYAFGDWDSVVRFIQDEGHWWLNGVVISPYTKAFHRGRLAGFQDANDGWYCQSPLSGEWAGESIPELLGDLISQAEPTHSDYVLDAYTTGYDEYFINHAPHLIEVEE